jgi:hypothetical protein
MRADRDERFGQSDRQSRHSTQTILTAIAVLILAGAAYLLVPGGDGKDGAVPEAPPVEERVAPPMPPRPDPAAAIEAAPDIPEPQTPAEPLPESDPEAEVEAAGTPEPEVTAAPAPPTPEELDARLRSGIAEAGLTVDAPLDGSLSAPYLLDRTVSSLDQVARGLVPRRTLNLPRLQGRYPTRNEGQVYAVDPAGYARYDTIVAAATSVPVDTLAALFQRFRDELEDAYAALGYPPEAMDNTLIAALDAVIAAPVLTDPPRLRSKGALWAYADPELEAASDLQKQIMRSGPDNTRALQSWARDLRAALLNP